MRMRAAGAHDGLFHLVQHLIRMTVRRARAIFQRLDTSALVPVQPLVPCKPANAETSAYLDHTPLLALVLLNQSEPLFQDRCLLPAHTSLFGHRSEERR